MLSTVSGWVGKEEVVRLTFDPKVVSYAELVKLAKERECATVALPLDAKQEKIARATYGEHITRTKAAAVRVVPDTKYYLRKTALRFVPMTKTQGTRANAQVSAATKGDLLSPQQKELLAFIEANPEAGWEDVVDTPFLESWRKVSAKRAGLERAPRE